MYSTNPANFIKSLGNRRSREVHPKRQLLYSRIFFLALIRCTSYVIGLENKKERLENLLERASIQRLLYLCIDKQITPVISWRRLHGRTRATRPS